MSEFEHAAPARREGSTCAEVRVGRSAETTQVVRGLNPQWNETFLFAVAEIGHKS